jgi:mono/diheme cytochrome c family protein
MSTDLRQSSLAFRRGFMLLLAFGAVACGDPEIVDVERGVAMRDGGPADGSPTGGQGGSGGLVGEAGDHGGSGGGSGASGSQGCRPVEAEALPARDEVTTDEPIGPETMIVTVTKDELYDEFVARSCGNFACHGGADMPLNEAPIPFKVTRDSFAQRSNLGDLALMRVLATDPAKVMPPGSGNGSTRGREDPYRQLAERLKAWQDAGFPESFELAIDAPEDPTDGGLPEDPYLLSRELAASLTNIGNCLPDPSTPRDVDEMRRMDALFESVDSFDELPETLVETDLVSLDNEVLATRGVFSYAPTYTLFSDNASKMRYVRAPVGKTITYNRKTHDFDIPANTRFYKTFLKPVTDADGNVRYRKMETRLIVSRPDEELPDGSLRPRALRMSYAWDKDEKMARLVKDPFRNGEPFADRLCPYVVDERVTRDPIANPISEPANNACTYMTQMERAELTSGSIRHYAIPSSERCDQCHMGSSSRSYILGFSPWQADRRPAGEGGVYSDHDREPTTDEIAQLQRLIEYGVVQGIEPGEAKLEASQGERAPRNEHELNAQAYMIGNCAFCHNPSGFPTVQNPLLGPFNMFPDHDAGGVFQFPLERFSPRAKFGPAQDVRFPYITPAFGNFPGGEPKSLLWSVAGEPVIDPLEYPSDYKPDEGIFTMLGPWRSLIWRNVYTPFTYSEGSTIFIHMPRNVPDYDCRAHKIMASWMLSIPSEPKSADPTALFEQPYVEVLPDAAGFSRADRLARERVEDYLTSVTGQHCPATEDTLDPTVVSSPTVTTSTGLEQKLRPAPIDDRMLSSPRLAENANAEGLFADNVPSHAHWVPVDTTDPPGRWIPRRSNWKSVVVTGDVPVGAELARTIDRINTVRLSDAQAAFSLEPQPMGLWHPQCTELATQSPTVADLQAEGLRSMHRWLFDFEPMPPPADGRVHYQSRGEAVFRAICQNCHGREADSRSPLATTILELTGGQTRVANFVDGLFGPRSAPGAYARSEFTLDQGATPQEWQVRYMLFMTLGGTEAQIPSAVVSLVSKSPFYGQGVQAGRETGLATANMLESAGQTCEQLLSGVRWEVYSRVGAVGLRLSRQPAGAVDPFLRGNAHYELWESLCGYENEPIVRVFDLDQTALFFNQDVADGRGNYYRSKDRGGRWVYPADHPVGNQNGDIELGIQPTNTLPWCVRKGSEQDAMTARQRLEANGVPANRMPFCPEALFATAYDREIHELPASAAANEDHFNADFREQWLQRGAMNAGIAAYYYLDRWTKGEITPLPTYDACRN